MPAAVAPVRDIALRERSAPRCFPQVKPPTTMDRWVRRTACSPLADERQGSVTRAERARAFAEDGRACRAALLGAVLICCSVAPVADAQRVETYVSAGARVRIASAPADSERITGTLLRFTRDTLALATAGGRAVLQLPTSRLRSIEVSEGRARASWALGGAGIGGLGGGVIFGAMMGRENPGSLAGLAGFIAGGLVGMLGGGVVGGLIAPERWAPLPMTALR